MSKCGVLQGSRVNAQGRTGRHLVHRELIRLARREVLTVGDLDVDDQPVLEFNEEKLDWQARQWLDNQPRLPDFPLLAMLPAIYSPTKLHREADCPETILAMSPAELERFYEQWLGELLPPNPEDAMVAGQTVELKCHAVAKRARRVQLCKPRCCHGGHKPLATLEERPVMLNAPTVPPKTWRH